MLIQKCKGFSGYFQFQKGKLQYIDPKKNDFFELETNLIQAIQLQKIENLSNILQLDIIGNYVVIKSIQLPTQFAKNIKYWIYLHLHLLSKNELHNNQIKKQPIEVIQYRKNRNIRSFCYMIIFFFLITGLTRSVSYSIQNNILKKEGQGSTISELLDEAKKKIDKEEYNESIHQMLIANSIKPSSTIRSLLDDAYLQRGKYFISVKDYSNARLDLNKILKTTEEINALKLNLIEYEKKHWLKFSDITDLIHFSWQTFSNNLDHGANQERTDELNRTWAEFQAKWKYTTHNHPLSGSIKNFFVSSIY